MPRTCMFSFLSIFVSALVVLQGVSSFAFQYLQAPYNAQSRYYKQPVIPTQIFERRRPICTTRNGITHLFSSPTPEDYCYYTDKEVHDMKRFVLSISKERDDETRRTYVSDWIKGQASENDIHDHDRGVRLIHLWDAVVIEIGEDVQQQARAQASINSSKVNNMRQSPSLSAKKAYQRSEEELNLWAMVDMMVQSKLLMSRLGVPPRRKNEKLFLDESDCERDQKALEEEEGIFE